MFVDNSQCHLILSAINKQIIVCRCRYIVVFGHERPCLSSQCDCVEGVKEDCNSRKRKIILNGKSKKEI